MSLRLYCEYSRPMRKGILRIRPFQSYVRAVRMLILFRFAYSQLRLAMTTEIQIYLEMKLKDFGESMCDKTKLKVLNWVLEKVYENRCKCYRLTGSNREYQTNLCPIHKDE